MIKIQSDLTPDEKRTYQAYLSSRYEHYWHQYTEGPDIFEPVILASDVERLFGTPVDRMFIMHGRLSNNGYTPYCDVQGQIMTLEGLKHYASKNGLTRRKTYTDLLAAHRLFLYNHCDFLELNLYRSEMYDSYQLHQEFYTAVLDYLLKSQKLPTSFQGANVSIDDPNHTGIPYKDLMDYLHYGAPKPQVTFVVTAGKAILKCVMDPSDYQAQFTEMSYNIVVKNITIE